MNNMTDPTTQVLPQVEPQAAEHPAVAPTPVQSQMAPAQPVPGAMPLLACNRLSKTYVATRGQALRDINLGIGAGKIIGLLGPNGSGKTTLIKLINGLIAPTEGEVLINGLPPGTESRKAIAYLPDVSFLADWMTVDQILNFFVDFYADFDKQRALGMLAQLNIEPSQAFKTLSKGNKEKVQLVLVMSRNAQLYLLDEPIGGVDPAARDFILRTILTNYSPQATVVIATHLISDIESVLDEVIMINQGSVVTHDSVDNIRANRGQSVDEMFRQVFAC